MQEIDQYCLTLQTPSPESYWVPEGYVSKNPLLDKKLLSHKNSIVSLINASKSLFKDSEHYINSLTDKFYSSIIDEEFKKSIREKINKDNEYALNELYKQFMWIIVRDVTQSLTFAASLSTKEIKFIEKTNQLCSHWGFWSEPYQNHLKRNFKKYPSFIGITYENDESIRCYHLIHNRLINDIKNILDNCFYSTYLYSKDHDGTKYLLARFHIHKKSVNITLCRDSFYSDNIQVKEEVRDIWLEMVKRLENGFKFQINDYIYTGELK